MRHQALCCLSLCVVVMWCSSLVHAQTGSVDPTAEQLESMSEFVPSTLELIEQPAVDLRPWLPPVGQQQMNDCTAWAIAYAAKTYAEARDQGWKPDRPSRIFSPRFIYNQINDGEDKGSVFVDAVRVMASKGAATVQSSPYRPGDFKTQPNQKQLNEAQAFPVYDANLVMDRTSIRRALQRREVVVFGAHVGPVFLSGSFDRYTPDLFIRDSQMRGPNQRHGKHAMVIVGYDDSRGCFLIQNSWGTEWGWRGYAWVAYELFDEIRPDKTGAVFCNWGCTLIDVEEPIEYTSDGMPRPKPLDLSTLSIKGYSDIVRYHEGLKKYLYVFTAEMRGQRAAMETIQKVDWSWTDHAGKEQTIESAEASMRFPIQAGTIQNPLVLVADVSFKDGSSRRIETEIVGPNPRVDFRQAEIWFEDEYFGKPDGRTPVWEYEAHLDYPLEQRMDIVKVEWDLQPERGPAGAVVNDGFNGPPAEEGASGRVAGPMQVTARIHYNDGGIKTIQAELQPRDDVNDAMELAIEKHQVGLTQQGEPQYSVRLAIDYPKQSRLDIEQVLYVVDPHISHDALVGYKPWHDYEAFVRTHRDFRVTATIIHASGKREVLEQWVVLGEGTGYGGDDRIEVQTTDEYQGTFSSGARWLARHEVIGDRRVLEQVKAVTFFPDTSMEDHPGTRIVDPNAHFWFDRGLSKQRQTVRAVVEFRDGREVTLEKEHVRAAPKNDIIGLRTVIRERNELQILEDEHLLYELDVALEGPSTDLSRYHSVDWFHTVDGRAERTQNRTNRFRMDSITAFTTSFNESYLLLAYAQAIDGFGELFYSEVTPTTVGDQRDSIAVNVREKFWGYGDDGRPRWIARLELGINPKEHPSPFKRMVITPRSVDGTSFQATESAGLIKELIVRGPRTFDVVVEFEDGSTQSVEGTMPTWCARPDEPLFLRAYKVADPALPAYGVTVDGWEQVRRQIRRVSFDFEQEFADKEYTYPGQPPMPITEVYRIQGTAPQEVTVRVVLADGSEWARTMTIGGPRAVMTLRGEDRYWGDGSWETTLIPTGDWIDLHERSWVRTGVQEYFTDMVHAWPPGSVRLRSSAGSLKVTPHATYDEQEVATANLLVGPRPGQTEGWRVRPPEEIELVVERPRAGIADHSSEEWVAYLRGPEREMIEVTSVAYTWKIGDERGRGRSVFRWGELHEGFEQRIFGGAEPEVSALVMLRDGNWVQLTNGE